MDLKLNSDLAKSADNIAAGIKETGKYIGTITRAEFLHARTGTKGLGLSFKTDTGLTADYLDLYHTKADGEQLSSLKTVNALLCCTKTQEVKVRKIKVEKWNNDTKARETVEVDGYPDLMGKRVGFLLQKVLETDDNGKDRERLQIFAVFNAETELTASEMYAKKVNPERLSSMLDALMARPIADKRKKRGGGGGGGYSDSAGADRFDDMPDDLPF
jgi:hypothetical protein